MDAFGWIGVILIPVAIIGGLLAWSSARQRQEARRAKWPIVTATVQEGEAISYSAPGDCGKSLDSTASVLVSGARYIFLRLVRLRRMLWAR